MHPKADLWTVVVVGGWNPRIFRPEWLKGRLTKSNEIGVEVQLHGGTALRFLFDEMVLTVTGSRLTVGLTAATTVALDRALTVATSALAELPHTPVTAAGVNLTFVEEKEPPQELLSVFSLSDADKLAAQAIKVEASVVARQMRVDDQVLNFKLQLDEKDQVAAEFNFHADVGDADQAAAYLKKGASYFEELAARVMSQVYSLDELTRG